MNERQWMTGVCNETAGFLFRHDCHDPPIRECGRCGKPICESHSCHVDNAILCVQCAKRQTSRHSWNSARGRQYYDDYYYDPYFYGGYHYHGYHDDWRRHHSYYEHMDGDANDFTDADAASLADAADEDFESDMSES